MDPHAEFLRGSPETTPGLRCLKESAVRAVYHVPAGIAGPAAMLLKCYRAATLWDRIAALWQRGKGYQEFRRLREAAARGVPVVEPLAWSAPAGWFPRRGSLLLPWLDGARDLAALRQLAPDLAQAALPALGALLRRAHDAGVRLRDLHPGNVLVLPDGALRLIDLQSAGFGAPLGPAARRASLARLAFGLDPLAGPTSPAMAAVLAGYGDMPPRDLVPAFRAVRRALLGRRARRALRTCSEFVRESRDWIRARGVDRAAAAAHHAAIVAAAPLKAGRRGCVAAAGTVFGKRRRWRDAVRLWRAGYALALRQVATAPLVSLRREGADGWVLSGRVGSPAPEGSIDPRAVRALAVAVARCHGQGLVLRDLKLEHSPVDPVTGAAFLVDLDGVHAPLPGRAHAARGRDLGRLLASAHALPQSVRRACARSFLRAYLRERQRIHAACPAPRRLARIADQTARAWHDAHRPGR